MWIVPSEFSKALEGLANLGGAGGEGTRSWLDVEPSTNGASRVSKEIDTSSWFESQLPPAAEQPEAKIELSSIADAAPLTPPSLAQAKGEGGGIEIGDPPPAPPPQ